MRRFTIEWLAYGSLLILASHGLAHLLVSVLPASYYAALGFFAGDPQQVAAWRLAHPSPPYYAALSDLFQLDFGLTLDRVSVTTTIAAAAKASLPTILAALIFAALAVAVTGLTSIANSRAASLVFDQLTFLPPFLLPMIFVLAGLSVSPGEWSLWSANTAVVAAMCLGTASVLASQAQRITTKNLKSQFMLYHIACGASQYRAKWRLLRNLLGELLPAIHATLGSVLIMLIFVETLAGQFGLGALIAHAVRRTDAALINGLIVYIAVFLVALRVGVSLARRILLHQ